MCRVCWLAPVSRPAKRQRRVWHFDNHGQINDAVILQTINTPDLFIYIINDLI